MKQINYLLTVLVLMGMMHTVQAQKSNIKINWGGPYQLPKKSVEVGIIGDNKVGYTQVSHARKKSINLQKFGTDLKLKTTNMIETKDFPKGYMLEGLHSIGNREYLFYSTWSKSDKTERLFARELDVEKGNFKGEAVEMLSSTEKLSGSLVMTGFYQFNSVGKWNFVKSADSGKLMIYYRLKPQIKRDAISHDIIGMYVFDQSLKKLWGRDEEMPYTEKMMDNIDYQVDAKGNAYILAKVFVGDKKDDDYHYEVMMYDKDSKKPAISSFKFNDEKEVVDIALTEDLKGRMVCSGFYSKSGQGTDGAFFLSFDAATKTMKNINKGFYEFPTEVIKSFESKRTKKKMDKKEKKGKDTEVSNLQFRNIVMGEDGSLTLYGEQYRMYTVTRSNGKTTTTDYHYLYDDIYVTKIGPDGELKWVKKIPKAQHGVNTTLGLGFHVHVVGNDNYLFFIDNAKNANLKSEDAPVTHVAGHGGVLYCVKLSGEGAISKSSIFDFKEEKMNIEVRNLSDVTDKIVIGRAFGRGAGRGKGKGSELLSITIN